MKIPKGWEIYHDHFTAFGMYRIDLRKPGTRIFCSAVSQTREKALKSVIKRILQENDNHGN